MVTHVAPLVGRDIDFGSEWDLPLQGLSLMQSRLVRGLAEYRVLSYDVASQLIHQDYENIQSLHVIMSTFVRPHLAAITEIKSIRSVGWYASDRQELVDWLAVQDGLT